MQDNLQHVPLPMNLLTLTTLIQIAAGALVPLALATVIHRRWAVPLALVIPGALAALAVQIVGFLLEALLGGGVVTLAGSGLGPADALPTLVFAGAVGFLSGLLTAGALTAALVWLAPGARTAPQIALIGVGFGGMDVILRAVLAALVLFGNLRLVNRPADEWGLPIEEVRARRAAIADYFSRPPAEPLLEIVVVAARLAVGVALAALVGAMFWTGETGWFFGGVLWGAIITAGPVIFARAGPLPTAIWWAVVGLVSLALLGRAISRRRALQP